MPYRKCQKHEMILNRDGQCPGCIDEGWVVTPANWFYETPPERDSLDELPLNP